MKTLNSSWLSLLRFANRRTKNTRALRRMGIRAYSLAVRANVFLPPPKVFLTGPAKSGTHLLSDCLSLMPKMMFSGRHFALSEFAQNPEDGWQGQSQEVRERAPLEQERLEKLLRGCPEGMFVTGHARFHPVLKDLLEKHEFARIVLFRDPRDVVVSHALYVKREPLHHQHKYYTEVLKSDQERIMSTICSFGDGNAALRTLEAPLSDVYTGYVRWLEEPAVLAVRFEDMVGARGGGSDEKQLAEIKRLGQFVKRPLDDEQARRIAQNMYGKKSLTYRKGQIGDWRNHFTEAHRIAFKKSAGDILSRLGYEEDEDW